jgi:hypothetical protein
MEEGTDDEMAGAVAGFLATLPMTAAMAAGRRMLPRAERYPLPPRLIVERVLAGRGGEDAQRFLAAFMHYAYGGATGAAYPRLAALLGGEGPASGAAYGVLVWALSYLGWIPAAGILAPATRHPRRRVALMVAVHLVWGGGTGALAALLKDLPRPRGGTAAAAGLALVLALDRLAWHRAPFARPAGARVQRDRASAAGLAGSASRGVGAAGGPGSPVISRAPRWWVA